MHTITTLFVFYFVKKVFLFFYYKGREREGGNEGGEREKESYS